MLVTLMKRESENFEFVANQFVPTVRKCTVIGSGRS